MANRDFKKIERIMKDFSLGVGEGENGGLIKVDELPEVGEEGVLYETPDGKYYTCTNTTETETICDLKVGKSYKFKDKVTAEDNKTLSIHLNNEGQYIYLYFDDDNEIYITGGIEISEGEETIYYSVEYFYQLADSQDYSELIYTSPSASLPEDLIEPTLEGTNPFTEIPSVEINEFFVQKLTDNDMDLLDVAFLFVGGSHTETITTSAWEELGGKNKYFEFPNEETFKLEFYPQKFLDVLVKLNIDIDAEMETTLSYSTSGGIYIGCGTVSYASSEGHDGGTFYGSIYATEGSGNSQTQFELMINNYPEISYSSLAYTIEAPFTIKQLIEKMEDVCITDSTNLSSYRNTVLAPRIGIKTGSSSNETTWYDCSLEDMQSFLKVVLSND